MCGHIPFNYAYYYTPIIPISRTIIPFPAFHYTAKNEFQPKLANASFITYLCIAFQTEEWQVLKKSCQLITLKLHTYDT